MKDLDSLNEKGNGKRNKDEDEDDDDEIEEYIPPTAAQRQLDMKARIGPPIDAEEIAEFLRTNTKLTDIRVLDVSNKVSWTSSMVFGVGQSGRQLSAAARAVLRKVLLCVVCFFLYLLLSLLLFTDFLFLYVS
jgi:hypothetical protein